MKFVLIVMLSSAGGSGMSMWQQPAMTSAMFEDKAACEAAADTIKATKNAWTREARLKYVELSTMCLPTSSAPGG